MKKNMIALAVAGALVAPVAMAEVTISGGLQAELVSVGGDANSKDGIYINDAMSGGTVDKGNFGYLAFASSEDLGNGLKALARYSMNVKNDDGISTRDAYVGLNGGFGTFLAGRMNQPYKTSTIGWDPFVSTSFQARGNGGMGGGNGLAGTGGAASGFLYGSEVSNTLAYANNFAGDMVKLVAGVIIDEAPDATDSTTGNHAMAASVTITPMTGLDVVVAYADLSEFGGGADKRSATKVGAKYSAGAFSVAGQVEMMGEGWAAVGGDKYNVMFLTAGFKLDDANSINASFGSTGSDAYGAAAEDTTYMAVGFNHAFSKNTNALIGYRSTANMAGVDGADESALGATLRVKF